MGLHKDICVLNSEQMEVPCNYRVQKQSVRVLLVETRQSRDILLESILDQIGWMGELEKF